jgi:hypothetical protein
MTQVSHSNSTPSLENPEILLRRYVEEAADEARIEYLEKWQDEFNSLQNGEERQAELLLAGYLLTISDGYNRVDYRVAWDAHPDPDWGTIMGNLVEMDGHMTNFLFRVCHGNHRRHLAVTLDALDSRQRSPESIARDRGLMDAGISVLNFTDREVLEAAPDIAEKISGALSNLVDELLAAHGHINGPRPTNVTPIGGK